MSKPRAGACGICGCAVVAPRDAAVAVAFAHPQARTDRKWIDGHLYEMDDATGKPVLRKVRCHKDAITNDGDPRTFLPGEWW